MVNTSRSEIWKMFDSITDKYVFLNHFMSFGLDNLWRKKLTKNTLISDDSVILDLCTGTGDQIFSIIRNSKVTPKAVIGIDMSEKMLEYAKVKAEKVKKKPDFKFVKGDALKIPLDNESVDVVTISFGIRNVINIAACMREVCRVLKPSGQLLILEFSIPENTFFRFLHFCYLSYVLPFSAGFFTKNKNAYKYLPETIKTFPCGDKFMYFMKAAGFSNLESKEMTLGAVTLYKGLK